jgi:hypothetical protein
VVFPPGRAYTGVKRVDRNAGGFDGLDPKQVAAAAGELLLETAGRAAPKP